MTALRDRIEELHEEGHALGDIAAQLQLDYDASEGLLYLGGWAADDGNAEVLFLDADDGHEAATEYVTGGEWGDDWRTRTFAHEVAAWRPALQVDDGELVDARGEIEHHLITVEPDEPECDAADDGQHRWAAPHMLVGGCKQNPGVWGGTGCSIRVLEVCLLCGLSKNRRTASQGYETAYDYDDTQYGGDDDVQVDDLVQLHDGRVPDGLKLDSELADALRDVIEHNLSLMGHQDIDRTGWTWIVAVETDRAEEAIAEMRRELGHCTCGFRTGSNDDAWQEIEVTLASVLSDR